MEGIERERELSCVNLQKKDRKEGRGGGGRKNEMRKEWK